MRIKYFPHYKTATKARYTCTPAVATILAAVAATQRPFSIVYMSTVQVLLNISLAVTIDFHSGVVVVAAGMALANDTRKDMVGDNIRHKLKSNKLVDTHVNASMDRVIYLFCQQTVSSSMVANGDVE